MKKELNLNTSILLSVVAHEMKAANGLGPIGSILVRISTEQNAVRNMENRKEYYNRHLDMVQHVYSHEIGRVLSFDVERFMRMASAISNFAGAMPDGDRREFLTMSLKDAITFANHLESRIRAIKEVLIAIDTSMAELKHMENPPTRSMK